MAPGFRALPRQCGLEKTSPAGRYRRARSQMAGSPPPLRLRRSLAHFQRAATAQEYQKTFEPTAHDEQLTAKNNKHLQLAGSNNFRSFIVVRQSAVQSVQLARSSARDLCGKIICVEIKMQRKSNLQKRDRTESCKPENIDRRIANETVQLLQIWENFAEIRRTSSAKRPGQGAEGRAKNMKRRFRLR